MDITAAIVTSWLRGRTAIGLLQSVASGLLGANSFKGGFKTAALGLVLHFVIAFLAATVFYVASRKLKFLVRHAIVAGLLYGVVVYFFMNRVVVPLSAAPFTISFQITGLVVHMLCVGLPISLAVRRFQSTP